MPAGHCGSCFTYVINPQQPLQVGAIIPILKIETLRLMLGNLLKVLIPYLSDVSKEENDLYVFSTEKEQRQWIYMFSTQWAMEVLV